MDKLQADFNHVFESGKTYTHAEGLSCTFRQWRATHSHCRFLHGYSLQVTINFRASDLDERNWVQDFGGLKHLKEYLKETFDHKTLIAKDDPQLEVFQMFAEAYQVIQLVEVDHVGCEAFAKMIFDWCRANICQHDRIDGENNTYQNRVAVTMVEVREHEGNFARYKVDV